MKTFNLDAWEAEMDSAWRRDVARAWEEGRASASRGVRNNPYCDKSSKDGDD